MRLISSLKYNSNNKPNAKYTSVFKLRCPILLYNVMSHNLLIFSLLFMCVVEFVFKSAIKGCCNVRESS